MDAWTILAVVCLAISIALLRPLIYRRPMSPSDAPDETGTTVDEAEAWNVKLHVPPTVRACPQALALAGQDFPVKERPSLPLPDCPEPWHCKCHYVEVRERRAGVRRSGQDRRWEGKRIEDGKSPRRSGNDRRRN